MWVVLIMEDINKRKIDKKYSVFLQLFAASILPSAFQLCALIRGARKPENASEWIFPGFFFVCTFVLFICLVVIRIKSKVFRDADKDIKKGSDGVKNDKKFRNSLKDSILFFVLIIISFIARLPMIGTFQRWDAGEYFYRIGDACEVYQFTLKDFLWAFSISYHVNYGYSALNAIPQFLFPRSVVAATSWQILFSVLAIGCLYSVLRNVWAFTKVRAFLATLLISFVPIFYGLSSYNTPDYFLILFFIFAIYFNSKELYILEGFSAVMLALTKETATLIILGFYGTRIIFDFFSKKGNIGEKLKNVIRKSSFWIAAVSGTAFIFFYKFSNGNWGDVTYNGSSVSSISFNYVYFIIRIKQYFFTNFAWIATIIVILSLLVLFFKRIRFSKPVIKSQGFDVLIGLMGAMTLFCIFGITYKIAPHERYNTFFAVTLILFMCICFDNASKKLLFSIVVPALTVIFAIETFCTFDPLTKSWFPQVSIGGGKTMNYENMVGEDYFGDSIITNYEYAWLDRAFDNVLKEMGYSNRKCIYLPYYQTTSASGVHFNGNSKYYRIGWDLKKKRRSYYSQGQKEITSLNIQYVDDTRLYFPYKDMFHGGKSLTGSLKSKGVYLSVPYFEEDDDLCLQRLSDRYYIADKKESKSLRGTLTYYDILKKDSLKGAPSIANVIHPEEQISESELKIAYDILNGDFDEFQYKVNELYNYRVGKAIGIDERDVNGRTKIKPLDSVFLNLYVKDENGNEILSLEQTSLTVGGYGVIDEIDDALLDMYCGESRVVEYVVPENTLGFEEYAGQTVYITVEPSYISCTFYIDLSDAAAEKIYKTTFDEVWKYYVRLYCRNIVYSYYYDDFMLSTDSEEYKKGLNSVDEYYNEYFEKMDISEDEFLSSYAMISKEDFIKAKDILARYYEDLVKAHKEFAKAKKKCLQK